MALPNQLQLSAARIQLTYNREMGLNAAPDQVKSIPFIFYNKNLFLLLNYLINWLKNIKQSVKQLHNY